MDLDKIAFCIRLGNPIPCNSIDILEKMAQLEYIDVNRRLSIYNQIAFDGTPKPITIYFARIEFTLLIEKDRVEFARGDMIVCENPDDRPTIAIPVNKTLFEAGDSTEFIKYKFY